MTTLGLPSQCSRAFHAASQKFIVVQLANQNISPKSDRPALRVLGGFSTKNEALEHSKLVNEVEQCTTIITELHNFLPVFDKYEHVNDDFQRQHVEALLERDKKKREEELAQFEKRLSNKVVENTTEKKVEETKSATKSETYGEVDGKCVSAIQDKHVLSSQKFAVVSFLNHETEPCIKIYGLCPSIEEAEQFSRCVVAHKIKDMDIVTVDTNQWIYPCSYFTADLRGKITYRNEIQNAIMQSEFSREAKVSDVMATEDCNVVEIK